MYSPDSADAACGQSPGSDGRSLLHETPDRKPKTVAQRVLVDQEVAAAFNAGVGVVPLVRRQPGGRQRQKVRGGTPAKRKKKKRTLALASTQEPGSRDTMLIRLIAVR